MRKKLTITGALCFLLTALFSASVLAADLSVTDEAQLLSGSEQEMLQQRITELEDTTGWEIFAVTTEDAQGKQTREYADDFFDENASGEDGVVWLIDMDNREITISTAGEAIYYLNDERIDETLDAAYDKIVDGDYYGCFEAMADGTESNYEDGIPSDAHTYNEETGEIEYYEEPLQLTVGEVIFAIVIAGIVWFAVFAGIHRKYKVKESPVQYDFRKFGIAKTTGNHDRFVNQIVTHRRIPKPPQNTGGGGSTSGRSTVHTSSAGTTHGGGSRKF